MPMPFQGRGSAGAQLDHRQGQGDRHGGRQRVDREEEQVGGEGENRDQQRGAPLAGAIGGQQAAQGGGDLGAQFESLRPAGIGQRLGGLIENG